MRKSPKKKWVAALRSGAYKQGKSALRQDDRHCCLGVLCELAVAEGIAERKEIAELLYSYGPVGTASPISVGWGWAGDLLPPVVSWWAGLGGFEDVDAEGTTLATLNDSGSTFQEIAQIIEDNL